MFLLLFTSSAHAACPTGQATSAKTLMASLATAEAAFSEMDETAFRRAHSAAQSAFACLDERLSTDQVVSLHIHQALAAFLDGNEPETVESLQAATRVYGGDALPSRVAPSGTALRDLYDDAWREIPRDTETFGSPKGFTVYVDGKKTTTRATRTAILLQIEDAKKNITYTGYLRPGEPLPVNITDAPVGDDGQSKGFHFGVEAGLPTGVRVEYHLGTEYVESVALRVGGNVVPTGFGLMVAAAVDVPIGSGPWDFEGTAGVFVGSVGPFLIGGAAQYDPSGPFQLNLGMALSGNDTFGVFLFDSPMADINAQWVW